MNNEAPRSGKRAEEPQEGTGSAPRADLVLLVGRRSGWHGC